MPLALLLVLAGCARQEAPPGGPEDQRPPVVVRTYPAPFAVLESLDGDVRFEFDERISERVSGGTLNTAVSVSPRGGDVRVKHSRRALSVSLADGFQPGTVYRVTLNATVSDMFGNRLQDPFELVFSTGDEPVPTTLAGEIWNRVNGNALAEAVVLATDGNGLVHQARTGRDGIFAMRYVPGGTLLVEAFEDTNRNGQVDSMEVQGMLAVDLPVGDTLLVDLPVLEPDTSAAVVADAEALDSVTVVVEFDDYLDPTVGIEGLTVTLSGGDGAAPSVTRLFDEAGYSAYVTAVTDSLTRLDSIAAVESAARAAEEAALAAAVAADSVVGDSPADTVVVSIETGAPRATPPTRLNPLQGERPGPTRDGRRVLPGRRIVAILDGPLPVEVEFEVTASGAVNINGVRGGAGSATFTRETPEEPARAREDGRLAGDSLAVDTLAVDTIGVDTLAVDTIGVDTPAVDTLAVDPLALGTLAAPVRR